MCKRWYVGFTQHHTAEAFRSSAPSIDETPQYCYCVGPFVTRRGAEWFARNPAACGHVSDFERLAKMGGA